MSKIERALSKAENEKRKPASPPVDAGENGKRILATQDGITEFQELSQEHVRFSEHFRRTAARLKSYCEIAGAKDVVFSSAMSGEGKTTNSINCAISLCQDFNLSVCLVDCDLRNPRISSHFYSNGCPGMIDVLMGRAEIEAVLRPTLLKGLSIICSRRAGRLSLPLLNTERLSKFVSDMRNRFDFIIYDSSPILPVSDAIILCKHISALALVIEPGRTRRKHIEQIFEQVDKNKVIGFIMNYKNDKVPESYNYSKYYDYGQ
jgi:capsular exopolysaccharide synthesis family protein